MNKILDYSPSTRELDTDYTIINGDATNRTSLKKESVDLTVTSPPYNVGKAYSGKAETDAVDYDDYLEFSKKWLSNCLHWTKTTGPMLQCLLQNRRWQNDANRHWIY